MATACFTSARRKQYEGCVPQNGDGTRKPMALMLQTKVIVSVACRRAHQVWLPRHLLVWTVYHGRPRYQQP